MPLKKGSSNKVIGDNIREMRSAGYPENVAVAASMHKAGRSTMGRPKNEEKGEGKESKKKEKSEEHNYGRRK